MSTKNQIFDMTPLGMKFTVLKAGNETGGRSLDLHWELLPGCNMKDPLVHIHPKAIEHISRHYKWKIILKTCVKYWIKLPTTGRKALK